MAITVRAVTRRTPGDLPSDPPPAEGWPTVTAANTGVPPGTSLETVTLASLGSPTGAAFDNLRVTGSGAFTGSGCTFTNCRFELDIIDRGVDNTYTRCEAYKFSAGRTGTRYNNIKAVPTPGLDCFGITSDTYQAADIVVDGFYAVGDRDAFVGGSGNHHDIIQVRGVQGATFRNVWADQGTVFSTYFNATLFLEGANGGNTDVVVEQWYSRAAGYYALYLTASPLSLSNMVFATDGPVGTKVYYGGTPGFTQTNIRWDDETPFTIQAGV